MLKISGTILFFEIQGCLKPTGENVSIVVNAPDEAAAQEVAWDHLIAVVSVRALSQSECKAEGWVFDGEWSRRNSSAGDWDECHICRRSPWPLQWWRNPRSARLLLGRALVRQEGINDLPTLYDWVLRVDGYELAQFADADSAIWVDWRQSALNCRAPIVAEAAAKAKAELELCDRARMGVEERAKAEAELRDRARVETEERAKVGAELRDRARVETEERAKVGAELRERTRLEAVAKAKAELKSHNAAQTARARAEAEEEAQREAATEAADEERRAAEAEALQKLKVDLYAAFESEERIRGYWRGRRPQIIRWSTRHDDADTEGATKLLCLELCGAIRSVFKMHGVPLPETEHRSGSEDVRTLLTQDRIFEALGLVYSQLDRLVSSTFWEEGVAERLLELKTAFVRTRSERTVGPLYRLTAESYPRVSLPFLLAFAEIAVMSGGEDAASCLRLLKAREEVLSRVVDESVITRRLCRGFGS